MKTYHAAASGVLIGDHASDQVDHLVDEFVPVEEVNDGSGRWINCPVCAEALAVAAGGSLRRPTPPTLSESEEWSP